MIVKTNVDAPDFIISNGTDIKVCLFVAVFVNVNVNVNVNPQEMIAELLRQATNPTSEMFISSKYFSLRLLDCIRFDNPDIPYHFCSEKNIYYFFGFCNLPYSSRFVNIFVSTTGLPLLLRFTNTDGKITI